MSTQLNCSAEFLKVGNRFQFPLILTISRSFHSSLKISNNLWLLATCLGGPILYDLITFNRNFANGANFMDRSCAEHCEVEHVEASILPQCKYRLSSRARSKALTNLHVS